MKKFIFTLFLFVCGINITFGASGDNEKQFNLGKSLSLTKNSSYTYEFVDFPPYNGSVQVTEWDRNYVLTNNTNNLYSCVFVVNAQSWGIYNSTDFDGPSLIDGIEPGQLFCTSGSNIFIRNGSDSTLTFYYIFSDLIPSSDIYSCPSDLALCESDLLTCQNESSNCITGYSNFYINDILHPGTENIFLNIQDNIFWDYFENDSGLVVDVGSGYDQEYIDGVINVQSYRPTSEDFTQTFVGGLILFTPYVVVLLFVILVRNLIKKIFKTK